MWPPGSIAAMALRIASRFLPTLRSVTSQFELVVERDDADRLLVGHDVDRRLRRRLAELHDCAGHAPRLVEHDDERDFRLVLALERHRREPLELGVAIAAGRRARLRRTPLRRRRRAARRRPARPTARAPSSPRPESPTRAHVAEDHDVPRLELRGRASAAPAGAPHGDVEAGLRQRALQVLRARRRAFDVQHARRAAATTTSRAQRVVGGQRIAAARRRRASSTLRARLGRTSRRSARPSARRRVHRAGCASTRSPSRSSTSAVAARWLPTSTVAVTSAPADERDGQRRSRRPTCRRDRAAPSARRTRGCRAAARRVDRRASSRRRSRGRR